jgi:type I restriction enzyme S subunit
MSFPRYPTYKDSGVAWLGKLPTHWSVTKVKALTSRISSGKTPLGGSETYVDDGVLFLRSQNVYDDGLRLDDAVFISEATDESMAVSRVQSGDVLLNITGASIGRSCAVPAGFQPANVNQHVCAIRPKSRDIGPFLSWLFKSHPVKSQIDLAQNGAAREGLNFEQIGNMLVPIASLDEQATVTAFLDRETAKIDALVAEQEQLITLLKEKRQAVISHAVTKGLDPSVPMKDSGVEWLGEVPVHWAVSALSYLSFIETGSTPDRSEPRYWNGAIPWLKTGEINWEPIREAEEFITEEGLANSAAKLSKPGTMLMAMYGQGVTRGRVALLEIEAAYNQACAAISFGPRILPEFGRYFFMAAYEHIREGGNETSQMNLSAGLIAKFRLPVPPIGEQASIVRLLDKELSQLQVLGGEADKAISLLNERRAALISAAVTGQIDVHGLEPAHAP